MTDSDPSDTHTIDLSEPDNLFVKVDHETQTVEVRPENIKADNHTLEGVVPVEALEDLVQEFEDKQCLYAKQRLEALITDYNE